MLKRIFLADPFAATVTGMLCLLIVWKLALTMCCMAPARLQGVLAPAAGDGAHQLVLLDARDPVPALPPPSGATRFVRRLDWTGVSRNPRADADRQLGQLIRAYGYSELPLLLTLDDQGHVVRVQAVAK